MSTRPHVDTEACCGDCWVSPFRCPAERRTLARHNHADTALYDPARCQLCAWYQAKVLAQDPPQP